MCAAGNRFTLLDTTEKVPHCPSSRPSSLPLPGRPAGSVQGCSASLSALQRSGFRDCVLLSCPLEPPKSTLSWAPCVDGLDSTLRQVPLVPRAAGLASSTVHGPKARPLLPGPGGGGRPPPCSLLPALCVSRLVSSRVGALLGGRVACTSCCPCVKRSLTSFRKH